MGSLVQYGNKLRKGCVNTMRVHIFSKKLSIIKGAHSEMYVISDYPLLLTGDPYQEYLSLNDKSEQYSAIFISKESNVMSARRSITSSFNIYYGKDSSGNFIFSDSFSFIRGQVSKEERAPTDDAIIEHLLFRTTVGKTTFSKGISRLEHGEEVKISNESISRKLFDESFLQKPQLENITISEILVDKLKDLSPEYQAISFSGGTDSMILASICPELKLKFSSLAAPEFAPERDYAVEGAALLSRPLSTTIFPEDEFLLEFKSLNRKLGYPIHSSHLVHMHRLIGESSEELVVGQAADSVFGITSYSAPKTVQSLVRACLSQIKNGVTGRAEMDFGRITGDIVKRDLSSLNGFSNSFAHSGSIPLFVQIFGEEAVKAAYERRARYVLDRISYEPENSFAGHMELGHYIYFFCVNSLSCWREVAHVAGGGIIAPFSDKDVFEYSRSIPRSRRYAKDGVTKWVLKDLAMDLVDGFDANRIKLGGSMPNERYSREGLFGIIGIDCLQPEFATEYQIEKIRTSGFRPSWALHSLAMALSLD